MLFSARNVRCLILTAAIAAAVSPVHADPEAYQSVLGATAWIIDHETATARGVSTGSGVLVDLSSRLVVTNYHVVGKSKRVTLYFTAYDDRDELITDRKTYLENQDLLRQSKIAAIGRVVARWSSKDLALVQLDQLPPEAQTVRFAEAVCQPGERVHTVGNSGKSDALWVYSPGRVRQVYERRYLIGSGKDDVQRINAFVVETTSPTNGGDSGGPLVNDAGELVGVMSSHRNDGARLVTHAIDSREIRRLLDWYYDNIHDPDDRPAGE